MGSLMISETHDTRLTSHPKDGTLHIDESIKSNKSVGKLITVKNMARMSCAVLYIGMKSLMEDLSEQGLNPL
jgi:hypothetical protein